MRLLWLLIYSVLVGILLTLYASLHDYSKFLFSIGAVYAGIRFFRRFEQTSLRIWFILLSIFFYFAFRIAVAFYPHI